MTTITIELPSERLQKLQEMALKFGVSMEELIRASVEDMLTQPEEQFRSAAQYVLKKNKKLYKRLSALMRYLTVAEVIELYRQVMETSGGTVGILSMEALESAVAQPRVTFGGKDLYPTIIEKAAALGFSLIMNHAFVDGNKRIGHYAMETFLVINGYELNASLDEQEATILRLASGNFKS